MIILLLLLVIVGFVGASIIDAFETHCEKRFNVSVFSLGHIGANIAGWAFVAAGAVNGASGILLAAIGMLILSAQLIRLIKQTSFFHGVFTFILLSAITVTIILLIVLVIAWANSQSGTTRRVVIINEI